MAGLIDELLDSIRWGRNLGSGDQAWAEHANFLAWVEDVSARIQKEGLSQLALEWEALPSSPLGRFDMEPADEPSWEKFRSAVETRCTWLGTVPSRMTPAPERVQSSALAAGRKEIQLDATGRAFVDPNRVEELKRIPKDKFDLSKLVRMCEEINICFTGQCYLAVAMLTRAMLDHIPPIFGVDTFAEVANNCGGAKSFKEAMQTLDKSSRKIADQHLHGQIRKAEVLPNATQVDFSPALDVLLGEIVRIHL